jgi:trimeric autotransporter adhesin
MAGFWKFNRTGRAQCGHRQAMVEGLEERQMLSAAVLAALDPALQNGAGSSHVNVPYVAALTNLAGDTLAAAAAAATSVVVTSSAAGNTSVYGAAVTFSATVTGANPTGTVTFFDGTTNLGTGTAGPAGTWTLQTRSLRAGSHSITAVYGGDLGNAGSTSAVRTAAVTARVLTISGVVAANKVYDGTTAAALDFSKAVLSGILASDAANVSLVSTGAAGSFAGKNAGTGVAVAVTGMTLGGSAAGNYTIVQPATTANITPKVLRVTGITAGDRVYDGTTTATISTGAAALAGVLAADRPAVTLVKTAPAGAFADKNAGAGKTVTISGLSLSGTGAGNYTLAPATATASITPKVLGVTGATVDNKIYDATTTATVHVGAATLTGVLAADAGNVSVSIGTGAFGTVNAGSGLVVSISVTLGGSAAGNYTAGPVSVTATIAPKALTVSDVAVSKVYDGTMAGAVGNVDGATVSGILAADLGKVTLVPVTFTTGAFSSAAAGTTQVATLNGLTLRGKAARNYTITAPLITTTIAKKTISVRGATGSDKVYDGTTTATINTSHAVLAGVLAGDLTHVTLSGTAAGTFSSAQVGKRQNVSVSGLALSGTAADNYTLAQPSVTASITPRSLSVTGITAVDKFYDGTTVAGLSTGGAALSGVVAGDVTQIALSVVNAVGTFMSKNAGSAVMVAIKGLAISGSAAGNYTLSMPGATARISPKAITVTGITAADKTYDGTTTAVPVISHPTMSGVLRGDSGLRLVTSGATGAFADKDAGSGKTVAIGGLTLSGAGAANYVLTAPTTTAAIAPKAITVTGVTADKVYDATTGVTLDLGGAALSGVIAGDAASVTLNTGSAPAGAFASANVGTYTVAVSGLTLSGSAAPNYTLTGPSVTAHITAKTLAVTGVTAASRAYNGDGAASLDTSGAALTGVIAGDGANVTLVTSGATGLFANKNVGADKTVTIGGLSLTGSAAGNYILGATTTTASITPKVISLAGISAADKIYDGTAAATMDASGAIVTGVLASDLAQVTLGTVTGTFADANAGNGKTVNISVTLGGGAGGNYAVAPATTTATIAPATLTVAGITAADKAADGNTTATLNTGGAALSGVVAGDAGHVALVTTDATGTFSQATAGANLTVTISGLTITGSAATNYTLTQPTTTASIT